ncbi:MAG: peptidoglycan binding domain-containing protein [Lachnospiraceae bacterium]|nr:peptidoglycan binding domain-containing protein [Lachnospiraceae bacterium]
MTKEERLRLVRRQRMALGAVAALLLLYLLVSIRYFIHLEAKTEINGVQVGGMTWKKASEALKPTADSYSLTINGPLDTQEVISGEGLSLSVIDAPAVKKCIRAQHPLGWPAGNLVQKRYIIDVRMQFDEEALNNAISSLAMMNPDNMTDPVDAYLTQMEDGTRQIVTEQPGSKLDTEAAAEAIREAVRNGRRTVDLTPYAVQPTVFSDNENLKKRMDEWNALLASAGLTYRVDGQDIVLDGPAIAKLLSDDGESVTLSRNAVAGMIAEWKYEYDTYRKTSHFTTHSGKDILLDPESDYGYELNDEEALEEIYTRLSNGETGYYELTYWHKPLFDFNGGLGNTYVEIDLQEQYMWVWKDGEVVVETEIVSGLPVYGRITYLGCYSIKSMAEHVVLGDIAVEGYETEVNYWVKFNGGEGLHDASWREEFGGSIWKYNGSHGCVNVPPWVMSSVYANVEVGEAVVIYGDVYDESVYEKPASSETSSTAS